MSYRQISELLQIDLNTLHKLANRKCRLKVETLISAWEHLLENKVEPQPKPEKKVVKEGV
jgi:hypothetical protein